MKTSKTVYAERLNKLCDGLDLVPDDRFNMCIFAKENSECGAVACAAGWCPRIFPKDWEMVIFGSKGDRYGYPNLRKDSTGCGCMDAAKFFDINHVWFQGSINNDTRQQVIRNFRRLANRKEAK